MIKKPYALVLAGGGAKGSYQIGAWKAFRELGIKFNCVIGVSVGALNGALIAQGSFKEALEIWSEISLEKVINLPGDIANDIKAGRVDLFGSRFMKVIFHIIDQIKKHGGVDQTPLYNLIKKYTDENRIRKSRVDFGLVSFRISDFKPEVLFLEDIPQGMLAEYLLASASFPGFKPTKIKGKDFIDGGVYNNVPMRVAKERGYRRIIVVDISGIGFSEQPNFTNTETIYIKNSLDFGNVFDFRPNVINEFMYLGYLDTLRTFQKIDGIFYFYKKNPPFVKKLEEHFYSEKNINTILPILKKEKRLENATFKEMIRAVLPQEVRNYRYISLALLEYSARALNIPIIRLYKLRELMEKTIVTLKGMLERDPSYLYYKPKNIIEEILLNSEIQKRFILSLFYNSFKTFKK